MTQQSSQFDLVGSRLDVVDGGLERNKDERVERAASSDDNNTISTWQNTKTSIRVIIFYQIQIEISAQNK